MPSSKWSTLRCREEKINKCNMKKWSKLENNYSPWLYSTFNNPKCCLVAFISLLPLLCFLSHAYKSLVSSTCLQHLWRSPFCYLLSIANYLPSFPCLLPIAVPFNMQAATLLVFPPYFPPSKTNCYLPMTISNLVFQRLPRGMPCYSIS